MIKSICGSFVPFYATNTNLHYSPSLNTGINLFTCCDIDTHQSRDSTEFRSTANEILWNMSVLVRAQSWPLINLPVMAEEEPQCDAEDDNNKLDAEKRPKPSLENVAVDPRFERVFCCHYGCTDRPDKGRCCCQQHLQKNKHPPPPPPPPQLKRKRSANCFSRLLHFRGRSVAERNGRLVNGKSPATNGNAAAVAVNGVPDKSLLVDEKKAVTVSPTFQQLIMTRRLLCRHYYPEGGWGVIIIIVAVLVQTLSHGLHLSFGILLLPASRRFHTGWYYTSKCALTMILYTRCSRSWNGCSSIVYWPPRHCPQDRTIPFSVLAPHSTGAFLGRISFY